MAQGWSSPSSSTESERSANRADSPARGRDTSARGPSQIQPPAWSGLLVLELEQQQHPEHTEEPSARYASTLTQSSLVFLFSEDNGPDLCQSDTPSGPTPGCPTGWVMYVPHWSHRVDVVFVDWGKKLETSPSLLYGLFVCRFVCLSPFSLHLNTVVVVCVNDPSPSLNIYNPKYNLSILILCLVIAALFCFDVSTLILAQLASFLGKTQSRSRLLFHGTMTLV